MLNLVTRAFGSTYCEAKRSRDYLNIYMFALAYSFSVHKVLSFQHFNICNCQIVVNLLFCRYKWNSLFRIYLSLFVVFHFFGLTIGIIQKFVLELYKVLWFLVCTSQQISEPLQFIQRDLILKYQENVLLQIAKRIMLPKKIQDACF
jgi:hypothetical protein